VEQQYHEYIFLKEKLVQKEVWEQLKVHLRTEMLSILFYKNMLFFVKVFSCKILLAILTII